MSKNTLHFELTTPVEDDRPVYLSGNFNAWLPDKENLRLNKIEEGKYILKFPDNIKLPETFEYKYTKGGWNQVELDEFGNGIPNRIAKNRNGIYRDFVFGNTIRNTIPKFIQLYLIPASFCVFILKSLGQLYIIREFQNVFSVLNLI